MAETPPPTTPPPFVPKIYDSKTVIAQEIVEESRDVAIKFHHPPRCIFKSTTEVMIDTMCFKWTIVIGNRGV